jgi:hypothetical protein
LGIEVDHSYQNPPSPWLPLPKAQPLARRQAVRRKRSESDEASNASSKRPRHTSSFRGGWASSPGPNNKDGNAKCSGDEIYDKEGHIAHAPPSAPGPGEDTEQNVPFQQASSDMAPLDDVQLMEDIWEDVPDEGEVNLNATISIVYPDPTVPWNSSSVLSEPQEHPPNLSPAVAEREHSKSTESSSAKDLAFAGYMTGLPPTAAQPYVGADSSSCEALETLSADLPDSSLMKLLQQARSGRLLNTLDDERFQAVKMAADFLFSAGMTEDSFIVYQWIYDSLMNQPSSKPDLLFSAAIGLARSTSTASQDSICRKILLQMLHDRGARKGRESQETFLLHAFLTMIFQRQEDLARADFHCHRALECFLYPRKQSAHSSNGWQSLVWVACCRLRGSLTEERLKRFQRELTVESRQRVLSRPSDHLINVTAYLWSGNVRMSRASPSAKTFSRFEIVPEEDIQTNSALKDLLRWCAKALSNAKVTSCLCQSWRKARKRGIKLRELAIATLYCILHQQWRDEGIATHMPRVYSASWTSRMKSEFDIMPNECLAAIPEMLAITWPYMDEDMPLLSSSRTCVSELRKRAGREIGKLLSQSDTMVSHLLFEAYSFQCIPNVSRVETTSPLKKALHTHILQISSSVGKVAPSKYPGQQFELDAVNIQQGLDPGDRLPSLPPSRNNSFLSRSHCPLTRRTSMHSRPSNRSKGSRGSVRVPLRSRSDPSMNSTSSDLIRRTSMHSHPSNRSRKSLGSIMILTRNCSDASLNSRNSELAAMKSMSKRIRHVLANGEPEAENEPPSAAVPGMIDEVMDLEHFMGVARRSFESLSLDPEIGDVATEL